MVITAFISYSNQCFLYDLDFRGFAQMEIFNKSCYDFLICALKIAFLRQQVLSFRIKIYRNTFCINLISTFNSCQIISSLSASH